MEQLQILEGAKQAGADNKMEAWERVMYEEQVTMYAGRVAPKNAVRELMDRINAMHTANGSGKHRSLSAIHSALWHVRKELLGNSNGMGNPTPGLFDDKKVPKIGRRSKSNPLVNLIYDSLNKLVAENDELKAEIRKLRMIRDAVDNYHKRA